MASPMLDGRRVDPHKKAHFSLRISDRITKGDDGSLGSFSSVKYNHKPALTTSRRDTTLTCSSASANAYNLKLKDRDSSDNVKDVFTFKGQKTAPRRTFVLCLDPATQQATLEPLSSTYSFNLATQNGEDVSSQHAKLSTKRQRDHGQDTGADEHDLFDDGGAAAAANDEPDPDNPYDFRHFLTKAKEKRGDESEYNTASSPDYRPSGTGSAINTPQLAASRKPAAAPAAAAASRPKAAPETAPPRKRKEQGTDALVAKKPTAKKAQAAPAVRLDRRATDTPPATTTTSSKSKGKTVGASPASKIKSAETVHSSDESDVDDEDAAPPPTTTKRSPSTVLQQQQRKPQKPQQRHKQPSPPAPEPSPSPSSQHDNDDASDEDDEDEDDTFAASGLEIEVPDARPPHSNNNNNNNNNHTPKPKALRSLGLGQSIGLGGRASPATATAAAGGPISLVSAANSVEGSPNPHSNTFSSTPLRTSRTRNVEEDGVIDFGDLGSRRDDDDDDGSDEEEEEDGFEDVVMEVGDGDEEVEGDRDRDRDRDVEPMDIGPPAAGAGAAAGAGGPPDANGGGKTSVGGAPLAEPPPQAMATMALDEDEDDPLYKEMMEGLAGGESSEESEEE